MQETWVRSLGWEDPLEKGMATHSSILAWRIQSMGVSKSWRRLSDFHFHWDKQGIQIATKETLTKCTQETNSHLIHTK